MQPQDELLEYFAKVMETLNVPYAVVGSVASSAYGDARLTHDIDVLLQLRPEQVAALASHFPDEEFCFDTEAIKDAVRRKRMYNIIHHDSGMKIDLIFKEDEFTASQLSRRRRLPVFSSQTVYFASPEDTIIAKLLFYKKGGSDKHLRDIAGILKISGEQVDRGYVEEWAQRLEVMDIWQAILRRLSEKVEEPE